MHTQWTSMRHTFLSTIPQQYGGLTAVSSCHIVGAPTHSAPCPTLLELLEPCPSRWTSWRALLRRLLDASSIPYRSKPYGLLQIKGFLTPTSCLDLQQVLLKATRTSSGHYSEHLFFIQSMANVNEWNKHPVAQSHQPYGVELPSSLWPRATLISTAKRHSPF